MGLQDTYFTFMIHVTMVDKIEVNIPNAKPKKKE